MSKRYFTADLHFGSTVLIDKKIRPFKSVDRMNEVLIKNINQRCKEDDILIHVGDLCQFGNDREWKGNRINPSEFVKKMNPTFINIQGNHDQNNKVKSVCTSMRTTLGKFKAVSIGHFPSTDPRAKGSFRPGDVHICGHVHGAWKHMIDKKNLVFNINVGVDVWNYQVVSEQDLINYITKVMKENKV